MRYFLRLSYHGKEYHGWQRQPRAISVQQVIEDSLSTLLRTTTAIVGAGRTDSGVHASEMIAHMDVLGPLDTKKLLYRLNAFMPKDIAIQNVFPVKDNAHARFDAISRSYIYKVVQEKDPFQTDFAYFVTADLDVNLMNIAAKKLLQYTDFECFSKSNTDVKTYNCKLKEAVWVRNGEVLEFRITADRFLRNMVRAIVGTLLEIGKGQKNISDLDAIIASKNRSKAGVSVPAHGLYLTKIIYPKEIYV